MPDYTEEDVERIAEAMATADEQNGGGRPWSYIKSLGKHAVGPHLDRARAALGIIHPLAYTAGALAMKEAAALAANEACHAFGNACCETGKNARAAGAYDCRDIVIQVIRALPVPPRGSKL